MEEPAHLEHGMVITVVVNKAELETADRADGELETAAARVDDTWTTVETTVDPPWQELQGLVRSRVEITV